MKTRHRRTLIIVTFAIAAVALSLSFAAASRGTQKKQSIAPQQIRQARIARGEYLVRIGGCNDCHTPMIMGPKGPEHDMSRMLAGHPESETLGAPPRLEQGWGWTGSMTNTAFAGPWGISYAKNLTPDRLTGIGIWNEEIFIKTIRSGRHWGVSRPILPPMPWQNYAAATDEDLKAIFAYLQSIKPVKNEVPEPVIAPRPGA